MRQRVPLSRATIFAFLRMYSHEPLTLWKIANKYIKFRISTEIGHYDDI